MYIAFNIDVTRNSHVLEKFPFLNVKICYFRNNNRDVNVYGNQNIIFLKDNSNLLQMPKPLMTLSAKDVTV